MRAVPQCDPARDLGWVLHGLWPQYEDGWPSDCRTTDRDPTRRETAAMADIMGTGGSPGTSGRSTAAAPGLPPEDYFAKARQAYENVTRPEVLRRLDRPVRLPASVVEDAFLEANPGWDPDMVTITCREGRIQEARVCLTRDLEPRPSAAPTSFATAGCRTRCSTRSVEGQAPSPLMGAPSGSISSQVPPKLSISCPVGGPPSASRSKR
jgi:ribonuclease T2